MVGLNVIVSRKEIFPLYLCLSVPFFIYLFIYFMNVSTGQTHQ